MLEAYREHIMSDSNTLSFNSDTQTLTFSRPVLTLEQKIAGQQKEKNPKIEKMEAKVEKERKALNLELQHDVPSTPQAQRHLVVRCITEILLRLDNNGTVDFNYLRSCVEGDMRNALEMAIIEVTNALL